MLKEDELMRKKEKVKQLAEKLVSFFSQEANIAAVFLFGSFGTEYENQFSDIDLGIVFMPGAQVNLRDELDLEARLSLHLQTDNVDLVNLNKAPLNLRFQAVKDGELIYEKDYPATSDFLENTYRYYLDYSYHFKVMERERARAMREVYADGE